MDARIILPAVASLVLGAGCAWSRGIAPQAGQDSEPLNESGHVQVAGKSTPYLIRRLPVSSFPQLPSPIVEMLGKRGCLIPQTYEAHGPENVVHGSLEHSGSSDWAVLCSVNGTVSLLVFFDGSPQAGRAGQGTAEAQPVVLATAREADRLQAHDRSGVLGFDWGIDPATPEQVHEAQNGMDHQPPRVDHDALSDSIIEHRTVYHFYRKGAWTVLEMPE